MKYKCEKWAWNHFGPLVTRTFEDKLSAYLWVLRHRNDPDTEMLYLENETGTIYFLEKDVRGKILDELRYRNDGVCTEFYEEMGEWV